MGQFQEGKRDEAVGDEGHQQRLEERKKRRASKKGGKGQKEDIKTKGGREQGSNWRGWEHGRKKGLMALMGG